MLWIVGNAFKDIRDYMHREDISYGLLTNALMPPVRIPSDVPIAALDFSSSESLRVSARDARLDISAILAAGYENYVLPAAILADQYRVPGLSLSAAAATTDKLLMRQRFNEYNSTISPDFNLVNSWQDIERFMLTHQFPVMLKPTNLMKSLFITMNDTLDELRANYAAIISSLDDINNKVYTMYPPQVLIEECMEGSMHTVAGFADASGRAHLYGQVVDCITGHDAGKGENYIYSRQLPSACSDNDVAEILEVSRQGVIALGLTNTMLHIELMLTSTGPKIIEIGARIGGYRSRMYAHASGVDMYSIMLAVSRGEVPDIVQAQPRPIAVIELFPDTEGAFAGVTAREKLESLPSLHYFDIKARSGQTVGRASKGYKASAVVILAHNDPVQFHADCKAVSSLVRIEVS